MAFTVTASATNGQDDVVLKVWAVTGGTEAGGAVLCALGSFSAGPNPITPNASGSVIVAAVNNDSGGNTAQTPGTNNTTDDSVNTTAAPGNAWYGHYTGTVTAGTPVSVGTTYGASGDYSYAAYEVEPSGTAAIDASTPAAAHGSTSSATTASFTPPGGAVLVAIVTSVGTNTQVYTISDTSGLGLTWTQRGTTATGGFTGSAAVYTTTLPGAGTVNAGLATATGTAPQPGIAGQVTSVGTPANVHSATGSVTGTWPAGSAQQAGRLLVAVVTAAASTSAAAISTPSGWAKQIEEGNSATAHARAAIYTKTAAGGDTAPAFTSTESGTAGGMNCMLFELINADTTTIIDTSGVFASGSTSATLNSTTFTCTTSAAPSAAGGYAFAVFSQERAAGNLTFTDAGTGWAKLLNGSGVSTVGQAAILVQQNPSTGGTLNDHGAFSTTTSAFGAAIVAVIKLGAPSTTVTAGLATAAGTALNTAFTYAGAGAATATGTAQPPVFGTYITAIHQDATLGGWFTDPAGKPQLWVATETWGLPVNAGNYSSTYQADYDTFFANRAAQGFTVCMTDPVWAEAGQATTYNGNDWDGTTPLAGGSTDPSTAALNSTFWTRIDYMMSSALANNITIGFVIQDSSDPGNTSGLMHSWTSTQWQAWATKVGTRYASAKNLIWLVGNDAFDDGSGGTNTSIWNAVLAGLSAAGATQPITPWYNSECTSRYVTDTSTSEYWGVTNAEFNFCYSYNAIYWILEYAYLEVASEGASALLPVVWGDGLFYTGSSGSGYFAGDDRALRQQWWWALASGARGVLGEAENVYPWASTSAAAVTGDWFFANNAANIVTTFAGLAGWHQLVPDTSNALVTAGRGTRVSGLASGGGGGSYSGFTNAYVAASRTPDSGSGSSLAVLYLPNHTTITIDQTKLVSGYTATWVDPVSGATSSATAGSTYNSTAKGSNSQGDPDWVLILQASSGTTATAGLATGTGTAQTPSIAVTASAGLATAAGTARQAAPAVTGNAQAATGTGTARPPAPAITANTQPATATGTAQPPIPAVTTPAGLTTATGTALQPTIQTSGSTTATAGLATAAGAALNATVTITASSALATGTGAAQAPAPALSAPAGLATAAGSAQTATAAITVTAGLATASGAALPATIAGSGAANASAATAAGTAQQPSAAITAPGVAAAATGTARTPIPQVTAIAGLATGTGTALQPSIQASGSTTASAGVATATATAQQPAPQVAALPQQATATGTAQPGQRIIPAGLATAAGTAQAPALTVLAQAQAAIALAQALNGTVPAQHVPAASTATVTDPRDGTATVTAMAASTSSVT